MTIEIKIYNIVSELVYEYTDETDKGKLSWDLRNKDNKKVISGIYIYIIHSGDEKKVGKISVTR